MGYCNLCGGGRDAQDREQEIHLCQLRLIDRRLHLYTVECHSNGWNKKINLKSEKGHKRSSTYRKYTFNNKHDSPIKIVYLPMFTGYKIDLTCFCLSMIHFQLTSIKLFSVCKIKVVFQLSVFQ